MLLAVLHSPSIRGRQFSPLHLHPSAQDAVPPPAATCRPSVQSTSPRRRRRLASLGTGLHLPLEVDQGILWDAQQALVRTVQLDHEQEHDRQDDNHHHQRPKVAFF